MGETEDLTAMTTRTACYALLIVLLTSTARSDEDVATLVLRGGRVITVDGARPEARALAVRGDRIAAVGTSAGMTRYIGPDTRVIELRGALAIPGFIEGHGHFLSMGRAKMVLDLNQARSWKEIVGMVEREVAGASAGRWILGRGWHQAKWSETPEPSVDGYPTHVALSRVSPENPVLLTHASGHMSIANARAMALGGVERGTEDPSGGVILRDAGGEPIGVLRETAMALVSRAHERARSDRSRAEQAAERDRAIALAIEECLSNGVTSFQDAGSSLATIDRLRELAEGGQLKVRLWVMMNDANEVLERSLPARRVVGAGNHHLTVRAIKRAIDGALGTHGAWLLEPYDDLPASVGLNTGSVESIRRTAELAVEHDLQLCVHAIGDRANGRRWISSKSSSGAIPTEPPCAGGSSMPSTCTRATSRDSRSWAWSPPCRRFTAPRTLPSSSSVWVSAVRRRELTSGKASSALVPS